jgi:hypothetical protein
LQTAKGDRRWAAYIARWVGEEHVENFDQKIIRGKIIGEI